MTVAWTTLLVILLLLPGVGFFIGYWSQERYTRQIISSTAIGEVAMAFYVAVVIHFVALSILHAVAGFSLFFYVQPLIDFDTEPRRVLLDQIKNRIDGIVFYVIFTCALAFFAGLITARVAMFGFLRQYLATHGWAYDLVRGKRGTHNFFSYEKEKKRIVTTHVLTKSIENNRAIMYAGHLEDFFLDSSGSFSYIVLKNCSRFYMTFDQASPITTGHVPLLSDPDHAGRAWEYLVIQGSDIANVLFDPLGESITGRTQAAVQALDAELAASKVHEGEDG